MQIRCNMCGAIQRENDLKQCIFCNNQLSSSIVQDKSPSFKPLKSELYGRNQDKLSFKNRSISSLNDLIEIYTDEEIERVRFLNLKGNNITNLNGLSRFKLNTLILSDNNIRIFDELPKLKTEYLTYKLKTYSDPLNFDLKNNIELVSISDNVIDKINNIVGLQRFNLILIGCNSFDFECLSKIKFNDILDCESNYNCIKIFVDSDIKLPDSLKEIGFESIENERILFDENCEEYLSTAWRFQKKIVGRIKIGEFRTRELDEEKVSKIAIEYRSTRNKQSAISMTKILFNISEEFATRIFDEIIETESLSLKKKGNNKGKIGCFVATAVMGDYNHPVVLDLREFRDNWLLKHELGIRFTNWYYTYGPFAARAIEKSILLKLLSYILIVKPLHLLTKKIK